MCIELRVIWVVNTKMIPRNSKKYWQTEQLIWQGARRLSAPTGASLRATLPLDPKKIIRLLLLIIIIIFKLQGQEASNIFVFSASSNL